jgi:hypothetical protein
MFWLASNCENPSSNPLQIACCGIQEAACDFVNCSMEAGDDFDTVLQYFSKYQAETEYIKGRDEIEGVYLSVKGRKRL